MQKQVVRLYSYGKQVATPCEQHLWRCSAFFGITLDMDEQNQLHLLYNDTPYDLFREGHLVRSKQFIILYKSGVTHPIGYWGKSDTHTCTLEYHPVWFSYTTVMNVLRKLNKQFAQHLVSFKQQDNDTIDPDVFEALLLLSSQQPVADNAGATAAVDETHEGLGHNSQTDIEIL
jgi:hypothetical protein